MWNGYLIIKRIKEKFCQGQVKLSIFPTFRKSSNRHTFFTVKRPTFTVSRLDRLTCDTAIWGKSNIRARGAFLIFLSRETIRMVAEVKPIYSSRLFPILNADFRCVLRNTSVNVRANTCVLGIRRGRICIL